METYVLVVLALSALQGSFAFSKYGRSCEDQSCLTGQKCVIVEDRCEWPQTEQEGKCGKRPTCVSDGRPMTSDCSTYPCPPTMRCLMDGSVPKCVPGKKIGTPDQKIELSPSRNPSYSPSAPPLYPQVPTSGGSLGGGGGYPPANSNNYLQYPGATTRRPQSRPENFNKPPTNYAGGPINSGYPGYPGQSSYPSAQRPQYPSNMGGGYQPPGGLAPGGYPRQPNYPYGAGAGANIYGGGAGANVYGGGYGGSAGVRPKSSGDSISDSPVFRKLLEIGKKALVDYVRNRQPQRSNENSFF